ncbi:hypothetical protein, partial [Robinsoniella peoriensis]|uniref:hypothetical protein n=1 Tax=Robinsoniella peoriensis TaxID=180332 RepID=UPI00363E91EC
GFRSECPRAAKKCSGKVRKCQFCGKHSKPMSWSAPFSFRTLPTSTKRPLPQQNPNKVIKI